MSFPLEIFNLFNHFNKLIDQTALDRNPASDPDLPRNTSKNKGFT
jgi:hypothetical protein